MPALITDKFRVYNAKQFLESFDEAVGTEHFFFVGRSSDWASVVEYYGVTGGAVPTSGTITLNSSAPVDDQYAVTIVGAVEGALLVTGLDPALVGSTNTNGLAFGDDIDFGSGVLGKVLRVRSATEDQPLRPLDNQDEKYNYYREIIAAKRIYDATLGDATGVSPDLSYVSPVIQRFDHGINEDFTQRTTPYDMWRPSYSSTPNFTRLSQGSSGEAGIANLEMVVRNANYEVFMCIDNQFDSVSGAGGTPANQANGPTLATAAADADDVGYFAGNGIYTDSEGYRWKYLYTLSTTDVLRFQSQKFIPLATFAGVAVTGPEVVSIINPGSGFFGGSAGTGTAYVPVNGDGQVDDANLCVAKLEFSGGVCTSARIMVNGEGILPFTPTDYTYATLAVEEGADPATHAVRHRYGFYTAEDLATAIAASEIGTGLALEVIIPPQGGYGSASDLTFQEQLNAKRVMCNVRLTFAEGSGDFPVTNDFRRIGLLRDPNQYDGTPFEGGANAIETVKNSYAVHFQAGNDVVSNFVPDERITQVIATTAGANITASGTVIEWLPVDEADPTLGGTLRYYQDAVLDRENGQVHHFVPDATNGYVQSAQVIEGSVSGLHTAPNNTVFNVAYTNGSTTVGGSSPAVTDGELYPELQPYSGEIIYVENRRLITRAEDQIEDIKLVIEF